MTTDNIAEGTSGGSALTVGLGVKPWTEERFLRQAIMTPAQQQLAERGICPKCSGKLLRLSEADDMTFNVCKECHDVWVLTPNAEVKGD